ncbi:uncharacterized protein LOC105234133 isoform X5 [Bactrocera dorsalis]|uniref:Uncharacterized protein LOC105234133 isoform X1 n=1 Tax=Bactrocera dorsalis TaxID=27457 RepID=A0ABM3JAN5_BACDO|nr:uncharacterized protein LOC105234133 isoform X1 [Bactrocera dorsalis]XP_049306274.1 uncharacterized protein LOC105234133 isoform X2 [Bactrocera dorsalis]XP_049306275.1 uncharacterized protein LOC105234133 isoform X3 [Bactrocera dorsalis]XP_049306276.1 uncharacterized protein LOC105234133 isoform X4 [Bactrocera dorsalis]XP_049306277.1 uncharacterized protein LOC105234133 isoform X5 [Bactrocera dorsalis]
MFNQDKNGQNNLMKMSNIHISCEYPSGKSKFFENKRVSFIRTTGITNNVNTPKEIISINNKRIFPPIIPTPNANNNFENVALGAVNDKGSFGGFRKQFSGRFKRFVSKQPKAHNSSIPPELKPQLKAIYVY